MNTEKKRLLIIDASPASLVWQLVLLQEEQFDTLTASRADEGLRIARLELPDLVLIDVATRTADGLAVCRALRAAPETSGIPIILILSRGLGGTSMRVDVEFDERITKPLDGAEYLMKIRRCLEKRSAPRVGPAR
jgi:DNA-binding response OmpR family regulator